MYIGSSYDTIPNGITGISTISSPIEICESTEELRLTPEKQKEINGYNPQKLACRPFIVPALLGFGIFVLVGIIAMNSVFINDYKHIVTDPEYLLLPANSTLKLSVNSYLYSEMEFSFTDTNMKNETIITFILASKNSEGSQSLPFVIEKDKCDLDKTDQHANCFITRYWPASGLPVLSSSSISCKSNIEDEHKKSFLVWKWFPLKPYKNRDIKDFNIKCPDLPLSEFHECSGLNHQLNIKRVLDYTKNNDSVVVMRFCTHDEFDAVEYRVQFNETRPLFTEPYNQYTMALNTDNKLAESVTVPLTSSDHNINIVVHGNIQPVEIQFKRKANVSRMLNNEVKVFGGAVGVIVASIVVCMLHVAILCMRMCRVY